MQNYMTNLRINDIEKELIRKVSIETNRKLVTIGKMPLRKNELVHKILLKALKRTQISEDGEIEIT